MNSERDALPGAIESTRSVNSSSTSYSPSSVLRMSHPRRPSVTIVSGTWMDVWASCADPVQRASGSADMV
ncbi:MAG: hypothetical protein DRJ42_11660 [Deltaproteobacteria bacterium]|nr:MAG: hypothetical protein DRJ42_11660 [Deltaproteobacteria bacterium]